MKHIPSIWFLVPAALVALSGGFILYELNQRAEEKSPGVLIKNAPLASPQTATVSLAPRKLDSKKAWTRPIPAELPVRLQAVFCRNGESYSQRTQAIKALTPPLSEAEVDAAYAFLQTPPAAYPTVYVGGEHVLKNELMNRLSSLNPPPADWFKELVALFHDETQDIATRDYALQNLTDYPQYTATPLAADCPLARAILWEAVRDYSRSFAGTALLGLDRNNATDAAIDGQQLDAVALEMATGSRTGAESRITALQVCARRRLTTILPSASKWALTGENVALRASAIATLGQLGGAAELKLLQTLKQQDDPALRVAVTVAIRRLSPGTETAASR